MYKRQVQELLYPIGLIAAAVPGAGRFPGAQAAVVVALLGILTIATILLWPRAFNLAVSYTHLDVYKRQPENSCG